MFIIPIEDGAICEPFEVKLDETQVLNMVFLHGTPEPTICIVYDNIESRSVAT